MAMAWIDKNGGSSAKVKFVEVPFPQMEATLSAGKIDAISVHEPFATAAIEKGNTRLLAHPWGDVLPKFLIASWFASEKWIAGIVADRKIRPESVMPAGLVQAMTDQELRDLIAILMQKR